VHSKAKQQAWNKSENSTKQKRPTRREKKKKKKTIFFVFFTKGTIGFEIEIKICQRKNMQT
jgi:hypothetical protein